MLFINLLEFGEEIKGNLILFFFLFIVWTDLSFSVIILLDIKLLLLLYFKFNLSFFKKYLVFLFFLFFKEFIVESENCSDNKSFFFLRLFFVKVYELRESFKLYIFLLLIIFFSEYSSVSVLKILSV
jgi:hypothetical protein